MFETWFGFSDKEAGLLNGKLGATAAGKKGLAVSACSGFVQSSERQKPKPYIRALDRPETLSPEQRSSRRLGR